MNNQVVDMSWEVKLLVDSEIDLSTRNGNTRVFINRRLSNVNSGLVNKIVINREHSSTWLIVGKLGQGVSVCVSSCLISFKILF